ncbi:hypothetical protein [Schleiferilactobacillus harbinensis]|jgi:thiol:disulfide interchange protein|uniref:Uncharacterized protein n=1 Tax=Schleiferilactobacillus harbinensis TaxID=304207 RepID=A0ABU7T2Y5_9LACO|nr:hypothetical protein [Lactobacillus sp.]
MKIIWTLVTIVSLIALIYGIWQWIRSARAGQNNRTAKIITAIATVLFFISIKSIIGTLIAVAGMLALVSGIWRLFRKRTAGGSLLLIIIGIVLVMAGTTLVGPSSNLHEDAARSTQTSAEAKSSAAEEESSAKAEYESLTAKESSSRAEAAESSSLEKAAAESSAAASCLLLKPNRRLRRHHKQLFRRTPTISNWFTSQPPDQNTISIAAVAVCAMPTLYQP